MKIQIDTDGARTQIVLLECAWGVQDTPDGEGKVLAFGDAKDGGFDVIVPLGDKPAKNIAAKLLTVPASALATAGVHDIADLRKERNGNGS